MFNTMGLPIIAIVAVGVVRRMPNPCITPPVDDRDTMEPCVMFVDATNGMPRFCGRNSAQRQLTTSRQQDATRCAHTYTKLTSQRTHYTVMRTRLRP